MQLRASLPTLRTAMAAFAAGVAAVAAPLVAPELGAAVSAPPQTVVAHQAVQFGAPARGAANATYARAQGLRIRANLVGASWRGDADHVDVRAKGADGRWSRWVRLEAHALEGPDRGTAEAKRGAGWKHAPNPVWVGDAVDVQVRAPKGERVREVDLVSINSTGTARGRDRVSTHLKRSAARVLGTTERAEAATTQPAIVTRAGWGADERMRGGNPAYASEVKAAAVHHTVSANTYAPTDAAAMVRGIYAYHVRSNGWNDIGYNFVVDRYGQVFEGRAGGMTSAVIGAHASGFNTATTGIALLGTHGTSAPTPEARAALTNLISWRMDQAHANPAGMVSLRSAGNEKYAAGMIVTKRAVSGHRDLSSTECPGQLAYDLVDAIRSEAWTNYGPKFAGLAATLDLDPATGVPRSTRFQAAGNQPLEWTLTVRRRTDGAVAFRTTQAGPALDVTWDGASAIGPVPASDLDWSIDAHAAGVPATPSTRPFLGGGNEPPSPKVRRLSGAVVSPNGDKLDDELVVALSLRGTAGVRAEIVDPAAPTTVYRTLFSSTLGAGEHTIRWDGVRGDGTIVDADHRLRLVVDDPVPSRPDSELGVAARVDRSLWVGQVPLRFSPNGDRVLDVVKLRIGAPDGIALRVTARSGGTDRRVLFSGLPVGGRATIPFDGRAANRRALPDGAYTLRIATARPWGTLVAERPVRIDRVAPRAKASRQRSGRLRIWLSERAKVRVGRSSRWLPAGWTLTSFRSRSFVVRDAIGNTRIVRVR